jgi:hypothetical protein
MHATKRSHPQNVTRRALLADPSGWPRLLGGSISFPEPCYPRTALIARVSRLTAMRAGFLSLLDTLLAAAPDALVLADASPAAILAPAPAAPDTLAEAAGCLGRDWYCTKY